MAKRPARRPRRAHLTSSRRRLRSGTRLRILRTQRLTRLRATRRTAFRDRPIASVSMYTSWSPAPTARCTGRPSSSPPTRVPCGLPAGAQCKAKVWKASSMGCGLSSDKRQARQLRRWRLLVTNVLWYVDGTCDYRRLVAKLVT